MAEIVKTVRIETGGGERTVKSLKKEISDLRDALLNMDKGGEEWVKTAQQLTEAQEELNTVMKAGKQTIDADASSIAGMEARYKSLYSTYKLLSQEQRKSAEGISMQKELAELSKNLNNVKKDAGNFKDNIGHYADDMMSAFGQLGISVGALQGPFKYATLGANGFKKALNTLAKHPVLLTLAALIGLLAKVKDAIKGNEELQMRWNKAMAAFKPIGDAVAIVLDKVASYAVKVAEGLAKAFTWVTNLLGITKKLSDAELDLADKENALIKNRREFETMNSEDEARVASLREQAMVTEDITEKERLLNEAKEVQEQINQRNLKIAEDELEIIKIKNSLTPSSTADLDAEAKAQQKVNQVRANGINQIRTLEKGIKSAHNAASSAADSEKKELDEILKRLEDNTKTEIDKVTEKYEKEKKLLKKYHKDTTALEEEYQKEIKKIQGITAAKGVAESIKLAEDKVNRYIQPSTQAYKAAFDAVGLKMVEFHDLSGQLIDSIKKEGKVTQDAADIFNAAFSEVGITADMAADKAKEALSNFGMALEKEHTAAEKALEEWYKTAGEIQKELDILRAGFKGDKNANEVEGDMLSLEVEKAKAVYEKIKDLDEEGLNEKGYTLEQQLEIERAYYDAVEELRQHDLERQIAKREREKEIEEDKRDAIHELHMVSMDALDQMLDTYGALVEAYKKDGQISDREAKKKAKTLKWLEGIEGAVAVASIVADTASAWMNVSKSYAAELALNAETAAATGPAAAATKAALDAKSLIAAGIRKAAIIVNGVAAASAAVGKTVAAIKGLGGDEGGESGSAAAAPQLIDSTPYSYTRELQTDVEREEQLNTPIYVRVTDIDSVQARVRVTENETTF